MDSLKRNKFTILRGPAGSGKDQLALAYAFQQLENGKFDKIILMCNPVAVRGSGRLGFYPGDKNEKLLDSQIGNFLTSKFGSSEYINQLLEEEKLELVPIADCRGLDLGSDSNICLYMTEAQNTNIDLMKLILQRAGKNCTVLMTGDDDAQTDLIDYEGSNNGLKRAVEVFKGEKLFGTVTLQRIFRSDIANIARRM